MFIYVNTDRKANSLVLFQLIIIIGQPPTGMNVLGLQKLGQLHIVAQTEIGSVVGSNRTI